MKHMLFWSTIIVVMILLNNDVCSMDAPAVQKIVGLAFIGTGSVGIATGLCHGLLHTLTLAIFPSLMDSEHRKATIQSIIKKVGIPLGIGLAMVGSGIYLARERGLDDF